MAAERSPQVFRGHNDTVRACEISTCGRFLLSVSMDSTGILWSLDPIRQVHTMRSPINRAEIDSRLLCGSLSPDGSLIALAGYPSRVELFDYATGAHRLALTGHTQGIWGVCFHPNFQDTGLILSSSDDASLRLWKVFRSETNRGVEASEDESLRPKQENSSSEWKMEDVSVWTGHKGGIGCCRFHPKGDKALSSSDDGSIRMWNVADGSCLAVFLGHSKIVWHIAFSPDGSKFISASEDNTARLWDANEKSLVHILQGHTAGIGGCHYHPDGSLLASSSDDGTIRLWDPVDGICVKTISTHSRAVWACFFHPGGKKIASASQDNTVHLNYIKSKQDPIIYSRSPPSYISAFTMEANQEVYLATQFGEIDVWNLKGHQRARSSIHTGLKSITSIKYFPTGNLLGILSHEDINSVFIFKLNPWGILVKCSGHSKPVTCLDFTISNVPVSSVSPREPVNYMMASVSMDNSCLLWDSERGKLLHRFVGDSTPLMVCTFSSDGAYLACGSSGQIVYIWNVSTRSLFRVVHVYSKIHDCLFAFREDTSLYICAQANTLVISMKTGLPSDEASKLENPIQTIALAHKKNHIVAGSLKSILFIDGKSLLTMARFTGHSETVIQCGYLEDFNMIYSLSLDGTFRLWDVSEYNPSKIIADHSDVVRCITYSPDGSTFLSGSSDGSLRLWDAQYGTCLSRTTAASPPVGCCDISPDGKWAIASYRDGMVRLFDARTLTMIRVFKAHSSIIMWTTFSPKGEFFATVAQDGNYGIWRVNSAQRLKSYTKLPHGILACAFANTSGTLALGENNSNVTILDFVTEKIITVLVGHTKSVWSCQFSKDDALLVTASDDANINLWSTSTWSMLHTFVGHQNGIGRCIFSPDGKWIASSSDDMTARIWDLESKDCIRVLRGHRKPVWCCAFSPDQKKLVTASIDHTICEWIISETRDDEISVVDMTFSHFAELRPWLDAGDWYHIALFCVDRNIFPNSEIIKSIKWSLWDIWMFCEAMLSALERHNFGISSTSQIEKKEASHLEFSTHNTIAGVFDPEYIMSMKYHEKMKILTTELLHKSQKNWELLKEAVWSGDLEALKDMELLNFCLMLGATFSDRTNFLNQRLTAKSLLDIDPHDAVSELGISSVGCYNRICRVIRYVGMGFGNAVLMLFSDDPIKELPLLFDINLTQSAQSPHTWTVADLSSWFQIIGAVECSILNDAVQLCGKDLVTLTLDEWTSFFSPKDTQEIDYVKSEWEKLQVEYVNLKSLPTEYECQNCKADESTIVLLPCGHLILCEGCSELVNICPGCQRRVLEKKKVFFTS